MPAATPPTGTPWLQEFGISKRWRHKITDYLEREHDKIAAQEASRTLEEMKDQKLTFCVEGNIGAGKSSFLSMARDGTRRESHGGADFRGADIHELIEVVQEPVDEWKDVGGDNLLDLFYRNQKRYAFTFQQYVLISRMKAVRAAHRSALPLLCS